MPSHKRVANPDDPMRALMKGKAMDIGKEVAAYIERMYPQAVSAASSTFPLAVRNCVHNEIVAALIDGPTDEAGIKDRLDRRRRERRELNAVWKRVRDTDWEAYRAKRAEAMGDLGGDEA